MFHSVIQLQSSMVDDLYRAAQAGDTEQMKLLLQRGVAISSVPAQRRFVQVAATSGDQELLKMFLQRGMSLNDPNSSLEALHNAAEDGDAEMVKLLLEHGGQAYINGVIPGVKDTALHLAVRCGHLQATQVLLDHSADLSALTSTRRCSYGDEDAFDFFVDECVTPLHIAAEEGHFEVTKTLLNRELDINATTEHGYTPLHLAVNENHNAIVQLLLQYGAKMSAITKEGETVIDIATRRRHSKILKTLEEHMMAVLIASEVSFEDEEISFASKRIKRVPKRKQKWKKTFVKHPKIVEESEETSDLVTENKAENGFHIGVDNSNEIVYAKDKELSDVCSKQDNGSKQDKDTSHAKVTVSEVITTEIRFQESYITERNEDASGGLTLQKVEGQEETNQMRDNNKHEGTSSSESTKTNNDQSTPIDNTRGGPVTGGLILLNIDKDEDKPLQAFSACQPTELETDASRADKLDGIAFSSFHTMGTGPTYSHPNTPDSPTRTFDSLEKRPIIDCSVEHQSKPKATRLDQPVSMSSFSEETTVQSKRPSFTKSFSVESEDSSEEHFHDAKDLKPQPSEDGSINVHQSYLGYIYPISPAIPYMDDDTDEYGRPDIRYSDIANDEHEITELAEQDHISSKIEGEQSAQVDIGRATSRHDPFSDVNENYQNPMQSSIDAPVTEDHTSPEVSDQGFTDNSDDDLHFQDALSTLIEVEPLIHTERCTKEPNQQTSSRIYLDDSNDDDDEYLNDRTMKAAISLLQSKYTYDSDDNSSETVSEHEEAEPVEFKDSSQNSCATKEKSTTIKNQEMPKDTDILLSISIQKTTAVVSDIDMGISSQDDIHSNQQLDSGSSSTEQGTLSDPLAASGLEETSSQQCIYLPEVDQIGSDEKESDDDVTIATDSIAEKPTEPSTEGGELLEGSDSDGQNKDKIVQSDESEEEWTILEEYTVTETFHVIDSYTEGEMRQSPEESKETVSPFMEPSRSEITVTEVEVSKNISTISPDHAIGDNLPSVIETNHPDEEVVDHDMVTAIPKLLQGEDHVIRDKAPKHEESLEFTNKNYKDAGVRIIPQDTEVDDQNLVIDISAPVEEDHGTRDNAPKHDESFEFIDKNYTDDDVRIIPQDTEIIDNNLVSAISAPAEEDHVSRDNAPKHDESLEFIDENYTDVGVRIIPPEVLKEQKENYRDPSDSELSEHETTINYYYAKYTTMREPSNEPVPGNPERVDQDKQTTGMKIKKTVTWQIAEQENMVPVLKGERVKEIPKIPKEPYICRSMLENGREFHPLKDHNKDTGATVDKTSTQQETKVSLDGAEDKSSKDRRKVHEDQNKAVYVDIIKPDELKRTPKEERTPSHETIDNHQIESVYLGGQKIEDAVSYMNRKYDYDSGKDSSYEGHDIRSLENSDLKTFEIPIIQGKVSSQIPDEDRKSETSVKSPQSHLKSQDHKEHQVSRQKQIEIKDMTTTSSKEVLVISSKEPEKIPCKDLPLQDPKSDLQQDKTVVLDPGTITPVKPKKKKKKKPSRPSRKALKEMKEEEKSEDKDHTSAEKSVTKENISSVIQHTTASPNQGNLAITENTTSVAVPSIQERAVHQDLPITGSNEISLTRKESMPRETWEDYRMVKMSNVLNVKSGMAVPDSGVDKPLPENESSVRHPSMPVFGYEDSSVTMRTKKGLDARDKKHISESSFQGKETDNKKSSIEIVAVDRSSLHISHEFTRSSSPEKHTTPEKDGEPLSLEAEYIMDAVVDTEQSEVVAKIDQIIMERLSTVQDKYQSKKQTGDTPSPEVKSKHKGQSPKMDKNQKTCTIAESVRSQFPVSKSERQSPSQSESQSYVQLNKEYENNQQVTGTKPEELPSSLDENSALQYITEEKGLRIDTTKKDQVQRGQETKIYKEEEPLIILPMQPAFSQEASPDDTPKIKAKRKTKDKKHRKAKITPSKVQLQEKLENDKQVTGTQPEELPSSLDTKSALQNIAQEKGLRIVTTKKEQAQNVQQTESYKEVKPPIIIPTEPTSFQETSPDDTPKIKVKTKAKDKKHRKAKITPSNVLLHEELENDKQVIGTRPEELPSSLDAKSTVQYITREKSLRIDTTTEKQAQNGQQTKIHKEEKQLIISPTEPASFQEASADDTAKVNVKTKTKDKKHRKAKTTPSNVQLHEELENDQQVIGTRPEELPSSLDAKSTVQYITQEKSLRIDTTKEKQAQNGQQPKIHKEEKPLIISPTEPAYFQEASADDTAKVNVKTKTKDKKHRKAKITPSNVQLHEECKNDQQVIGANSALQYITQEKSMRIVTTKKEQIQNRPNIETYREEKPLIISPTEPASPQEASPDDTPKMEIRTNIEEKKHRKAKITPSQSELSRQSMVRVTNLDDYMKLQYSGESQENLFSTCHSENTAKEENIINKSTPSTPGSKKKTFVLTIIGTKSKSPTSPTKGKPEVVFQSEDSLKSRSDQNYIAQVSRKQDTYLHADQQEEYRTEALPDIHKESKYHAEHIRHSPLLNKHEERTSYFQILPSSQKVPELGTSNSEFDETVSKHRNQQNKTTENPIAMPESPEISQKGGKSQQNQVKIDQKSSEDIITQSYQIEQKMITKESFQEVLGNSEHPSGEMSNSNLESAQSQNAPEEVTPGKKKDKKKVKKKVKKSKKKTEEISSDIQRAVDVGADDVILAGQGENVPKTDIQPSSPQKTQLDDIKVVSEDAVSPGGITATSTPDHEQSLPKEEPSSIKQGSLLEQESSFGNQSKETYIDVTPNRPSVRILSSQSKRRKLTEEEPDDEAGDKENQGFLRYEGEPVRYVAPQREVMMSPPSGTKDRRSAPPIDDSFTSPRESAKKSRPMSVPDVYVLVKFDKGSMSNLGVLKKDDSKNTPTSTEKIQSTSQNISFQTDPHFLDDTETSNIGLDDPDFKAKSMDELDIERTPRRVISRNRDQALLRSQSGGALHNVSDPGWGATRRAERGRYREIVMPNTYFKKPYDETINNDDANEELAKHRTGSSAVHFKTHDQVSVYHSKTHVGSRNYVQITRAALPQGSVPRSRNRSEPSEPSPNEPSHIVHVPRPRSAHEPMNQARSVEGIPKEVHMPVPKPRVSKPKQVKPPLPDVGNRVMLDQQQVEVVRRASPGAPHRPRPRTMPEESTYTPPVQQAIHSGVVTRQSATFNRVPFGHPVQGQNQPPTIQVYRQGYNTSSPRKPQVLSPGYKEQMMSTQTAKGPINYPVVLPSGYKNRRSDPTGLNVRLQPVMPSNDDETEIW